MMRTANAPTGAPIADLFSELQGVMRWPRRPDAYTTPGLPCRMRRAAGPSPSAIPIGVASELAKVTRWHPTLLVTGPHVDDCRRVDHLRPIVPQQRASMTTSAAIWSAGGRAPLDRDVPLAVWSHAARGDEPDKAVVGAGLALPGRRELATLLDCVVQQHQILVKSFCVDQLQCNALAHFFQ